MNIKLLIVITLLFLYFFFGSEKISYSLNKVSQDDITELKILKYLPKDNKTFFISNTKSSKIAKSIRKNYKINQQDEIDLVKNSVLAYLGIDLSTNKLEDIYDDELTITTFDNKEKEIDDFLIIFKIKDTKDIDNILNLTNKIDKPDQLIKISRENKLNYLKYIYRTNDNYIITSSNKNLILEALESSTINKKQRINYLLIKEILNNFKNEHNILLTKNFKKNALLNNEFYPSKKDYLVTLFSYKDKEIILQSFLLNNNKILDIMSYENINKENLLDKKNYHTYIYNSLSDFNKYFDNIKINSFEKDLFKELSQKLIQDSLLLISDSDWLIIFDKNNFSIENIKILEDFNKNSLENNKNIYTIYSKNSLKIEENTVKQNNFEKIFFIQSDNLNFISNNLINEKNIDLISQEFFKIRGDNHSKYFLNKKINSKNPHIFQPKSVPISENINYFFKNIFNVSIIEFKEVIKQSIPETNPFYYTETNLKIF